MVALNQILVTFFTMLSYASAFWFSSEEPKQSTARLLYPQQQDYYRPYAAPPLPYYPLQVPLPAHLSAAAVQNVQLVPCLCPVSQEYSYDNSNEYATRKVPFHQGQAVNQPNRRR